ncbi:hypothetical protein C9J85_01645 [Haloferax sp. wsp5]|nr:hypothetical protein C9J85_01645 [Haloferax sp. wsp5]
MPRLEPVPASPDPRVEAGEQPNGRDSGGTGRSGETPYGDDTEPREDTTDYEPEWLNDATAESSRSTTELQPNS